MIKERLGNRSLMNIDGQTDFEGRDFMPFRNKIFTFAEDLNGDIMPPIIDLQHTDA